MPLYEERVVRIFVKELWERIFCYKFKADATIL